MIILITISKLNLIGSGFLSFPDEFRYASSGKALKDFSELEFKSGIINIFSTQGRPGDALIKLIPNTIQFISGKILGTDFYESKNSFPLFLFNFLIYVSILIRIYRISNHILKNNYFALLSVLVYSSLTNSHIYLRHALPYDTSLLIFLYVIYKIIINIEKDKTNFLSIFYLGLFCFFAYLVYPGYILLYFLSLLILVFYKIELNTLKTKILHLIYFALGSLSCLIIFEILSRFAGISYIDSALKLSTTITQGSFDESFVFIFKYLIEVEHITGIMLIVSLPLTLFIISKIIINKEYSNNSLVALLFFSLTALYSIYAGSGYFFNKVVLYGRLLHQFFPFICIFFVFSIDSLLKNYLIKKYLVLALSIFCLFNYYKSYEDYLSHYYPRDIAWQQIKSNPLAEVNTTCEYENSWSVMPKKINLDLNKSENITNHNLNNKILIINCCYFYPVNDISKYNTYKPNSEQKLIDSKKHFLNFKAYQYEGFDKDERKILDKISFKIKVFSE